MKDKVYETEVVKLRVTGRKDKLITIKGSLTVREVDKSAKRKVVPKDVCIGDGPMDLYVIDSFAAVGIEYPTILYNKKVSITGNCTMLTTEPLDRTGSIRVGTRNKDGVTSTTINTDYASAITVYDGNEVIFTYGNHKLGDVQLAMDDLTYVNGVVNFDNYSATFESERPNLSIKIDHLPEEG